MRDSLSDDDESRWSTDRLVRLIDDAQADLVVDVGMLRSNTSVFIQADKAEYTLPSEAYEITRAVTSTGTPLDILSHDEMDALGATPSNREVGIDWETSTGATISKIIFDKQEPGAFKVFPIPTGSDTVGDTFTTTDYGFTALSEGDLVVNDFGVVATVSETAADTTSTNSDFGTITSMLGVEATIKVYYKRLPSTILGAEDDPEVESTWDRALRYYALAMAYADDQDTQNLAMSDKFFGMYTRELERAGKKSSKSSVSNRVRSSTSYNKAI